MVSLARAPALRPVLPPRQGRVADLLRSTTPAWLGVAAVVAVTAWALALAAVVVFLRVRSLAGYAPYFAMDVAIAVVYGAVVLVMLARSRHLVVWILVATGLGCATSAFLSAYVAGALADPSWPLSPAVVTMLGWTWVPGTYASMAVLPWLLAPGAVAAPRAARVVAGLALLPIVWRVLAVLLGTAIAPDNPLAVAPGWFYDLGARLGSRPDQAVVLLSLAGVARLVWVWRTAPGDTGRGFGWLAVGQVFLAVAFVPVFFPLPSPLTGLAEDFSAASLVAAQPFLLGALLVVVLGQRLWGIDATVDRATVWLLLTAILVAGYVLVAWLVQRHLSATADVAALVALGVLLVVSQPLRTWVQTRVDHLVYGPALDPGALLGSLAEPRSVGASAASELVESLREALRLGRIEVRSPTGELVVAAGRDLAVQHEVSLPSGALDGHRLGVAMPPGQSLDARTRRLIDLSAGVIGVFLELAQAHERLNVATARLVEVRHEERRMLRRDLHDGMGPALAGVGLGLDAVRRKLDRDPEAAARLLGELAQEVARRTDDVRMLARALLPAALDDGDLAGALGVLADRFRSAGLIVEVDTTRLEGLDTRRQIAVYHVAAEGVLNAHRHAAATRVTVRVAGGGAGPVTVQITDDGNGISDHPARGIGLTSMQERADELSGSLEVARSDGGGTRVTMSLP